MSRPCEFTHATTHPNPHLLPPDMHPGVKIFTSILLLFVFYLLGWTDTLSVDKVQSHISATTVDFAVKTNELKSSNGV